MFIVSHTALKSVKKLKCADILCQCCVCETGSTNFSIRFLSFRTATEQANTKWLSNVPSRTL